MATPKVSRPVIAGSRFTRLVVVEFSHRTKARKFYWKCRCDCGRTTIVRSEQLRSGHTRSCGCLGRDKVIERSTKHGHCVGQTKTPEYQAWSKAIDRCRNPRTTGFENYGGRGIAVCSRWLNSFEDFLADMGPRPRRHSLDRINNDGDYEPANCRWATRKVQANNTRRNRPPLCSIPLCDGHHVARGMCGMHYRRWRLGKPLIDDFATP